jgi:hypothetical protein
MSYKSKVPSWASIPSDENEHDQPSSEALHYFRETVLGNATCPICGEVGMQYLKNKAVSAEHDHHRVAY